MDRWGLGWDKENRLERDTRQFGWTKRYKEIEVDRQQIETNIQADIQRIEWDKENGFERYSREFGLTKR